MKYKYFLLANCRVLFSPSFNPQKSSAIFSIGCHHKKQINKKHFLNRLEFLLGTQIVYQNLQGLIGTEINASFLGVGIQLFFSNKDYHFEGKASFKLNKYIALAISQRFSEKYSTSIGLILSCHPSDYISINSNISMPFEWKKNAQEKLNTILDSNPKLFEEIQKRIATNSETFQKDLFYHFLLYFEKKEKEEGEEYGMRNEEAKEFFNAYWNNLFLITKKQIQNEFLKSFEAFENKTRSLLKDHQYYWGEEYLKFLIESNFDNKVKDNLSQKVIFHNIIGHTDTSFLSTLTQYTQNNTYVFNITDSHKVYLKEIYSQYLGKIIFPVFLNSTQDEEEEEEDEEDENANNEVGHVITQIIENNKSEKFDSLKERVQSGPNCAIYSYYAIILTTLLQSSLQNSYQIIKTLNNLFVNEQAEVCALLRDILNSNKINDTEKTQLIQKLESLKPSTEFEPIEPNWKFGKKLRETLTDFLPCLRAASDQENAEKICSIVTDDTIDNACFTINEQNPMDSIPRLWNQMKKMKSTKNQAHPWGQLVEFLQDRKLEEDFFLYINA